MTTIKREHLTPVFQPPGIDPEAQQHNVRLLTRYGREVLRVASSSHIGSSPVSPQPPKASPQPYGSNALEFIGGEEAHRTISIVVPQETQPFRPAK